MFRFILSFLAGFGIVYYLLKRGNEKTNNKNNNNSPSLKFPPEPQEFETSEKFMNILREFNKVKKDI
ncbi:MAG: hypothetical protein DSY59_01795 [Persephonella sp.]|nr:MAG: hypothetical protein DSY60_04705 [Persephonella sp.]RUM61263.1 MAG: hypothetical protein DSY59_01795 [Persephonella sp.]